MQLILSAETKEWGLSKEDVFADIMALEGEVFRKVKERETLRFTKNNKAYFIKKHFGIRVGEIFKNLLKLRMPIWGAKSEYLAIKKFEELQVATMEIVGYGAKGFNPLTRESFLITKELTNTIGMRDICEAWSQNPLGFFVKQKLIAEIAKIARTLHTNGVNHRDFYLAHFLLDQDSLQKLQKRQGKPKLFVIDLHRVQIRKEVPERWLIKDLSALYFSAKAANLTTRDIFRFLQIYFNKPWHEVIKTKAKFLNKVMTKAESLCEESDIKTKIKTTWNYLVKFQPKFDSLALQELLKNPDVAINNGELLTGADTCTVVKISLDNKLMVLKRYNIKSFWHAINRMFRPTRAARCWEISEKLLSYNLAVPQPVAMLERRFGPLRLNAYFLMEYIEGETALNYFPQEKDQEKLLFWARKIIKIFAFLKQKHIRHGDTKASNFIITHDEIYLIDLDGMHRYLPWRYSRRHAFAKDKARFMKNWRDNPKLTELFSELYKRIEK